MKKIRLFSLIAMVFLAVASCEKNSDDSSVNVNKELLNVMSDYYLWYSQMPDVNPNNYSSPIELMDALRVTPPDKWSYVTTRTELEAYYNQGAYVGFGFGSGFNTDGELIISFIFDSSPLAAKGIGRGWQIVSIDGKTPTADNYSSLIGASEVGVSKDFVFKSPAGSNYEYTFTKAQIAMNTVLCDTVYTYGSTSVGYFVLKSFISNTKDELSAIFSNFKSKEIDELIVDLRYNGGGQVDVSNYLANLIGGNAANGNIFAKAYHNSKHSDKDSAYYFKTEVNSLSINRVIFITTKESASASELVINGLKPFMDVVLIGNDTHGKPVGMYTFTFNNPEIDWAFVPICFTMRNSNNEGDYYNGLPVNVAAADDITLPFGNTSEASLNAALVYLGVESAKSHKNAHTFTSIAGKGLKAEIGAW